VADFKLRVPDGLAARFDGWAAGRGGRSPALRRLMAEACGADLAAGPALGPRPLKLTVRLTAGDGAGLADEAAGMGLTPNAWVAALVRNRLRGTPRFRRGDELALIAIHGEVRRIGVNVNQIARALNTAVMEGRVLDTELGAVEDLGRELRAHMAGLGEAFRGNQAYWAVDG